MKLAVFSTTHPLILILNGISIFCFQEKYELIRGNCTFALSCAWLNFMSLLSLETGDSS
ncbi:hypothetical protein F5146DRAFT_1074516 [Armillaria mellea]|nr:hypothetical protein F5146DRAFT_1074516 [Armillaria mellea]